MRKAKCEKLFGAGIAFAAMTELTFCHTEAFGFSRAAAFVTE